MRPVARLKMCGVYMTIRHHRRVFAANPAVIGQKMPKSEHLAETLTFGKCGPLPEAHNHISIDSALVYFSPETYRGRPVPALTS